MSGQRVIAMTWDLAPEALWIATLDAGLNRLDPGTGAIERFRHDPAGDGSLAHDQLGAVHVDRRGTLWVGTWGGLDRFDPEAGSFTHFRHDPADRRSLSDDRVRAILEDSRGRLWVGTHRGLNRLEPGGDGFERFLHDPAAAGSLSNDWVRDLFEDRGGRLWVGTDGGLNLWREAGAAFASYRADPADPESLGSDRVFSMTDDGAGRLWVATDGGGLGRLDARALEPPSGPRSGLATSPASAAFLRLTHDPDNPDSLSDSEVMVVHVDGSGRLWAGTKSSGLDLLASLDESSGRAAFRNYSPADGLPDGTVWGILSDAAGRLWLSTNGGLSRFDPAAETFKNFDTSHGLQSLEFNKALTMRARQVSSSSAARTASTPSSRTASKPIPTCRRWC